jgi:hypothetical protein
MEYGMGTRRRPGSWLLAAQAQEGSVRQEAAMRFIDRQGSFRKVIEALHGAEEKGLGGGRR